MVKLKKKLFNDLNNFLNIFYLYISSQFYVVFLNQVITKYLNLFRIVTNFRELLKNYIFYRDNLSSYKINLLLNIVFNNEVNNNNNNKIVNNQRSRYKICLFKDSFYNN